MKAEVKIEEGKGFHVSLTPESKVERLICQKLSNQFSVYYEGTRALLALSYTITSRNPKADPNVEGFSMGFGFVDMSKVKEIRE